MARTRAEVLPAEVRRVKEQFECWRADRRVRERIPPKLWEAAAKLCETYSIHQVSRWLRLNHTALQKRAGRHLSPRSCRPKPSFVEWRLPTGIIPGASSAEYVVEVEGRGDRAQRIHVRGVSVPEVVALARALRADGSAG